VRNAKPLQIEGIAADAKSITIRLANATKFARVHVAATRYLPAYSMYADLGAVTFPEPYLVAVSKRRSVYVAGRNIGDEYRYILERKYARKFPGNMLTRPGVLLNPWAIRKTEAGKQIARAGEGYDRGGAPGKAMAKRPSARRPPKAVTKSFANLDFLAEQAVVMTNLAPDKNGVVTIPRKAIGPHHQIHVVAVDPQNTVYRELSLPEAQAEFVDLRLKDGLDPQKHFTEQKQISVMEKGQKISLDDVTTSQFETYDQLPKAYTLYVTLSSDPTLIEFNFILRWPEMKDEEKRELYSRYACHELNFFIYKKDPAFFESVVQPYLKNKKDKTFLDHWLIGDDLSAYQKPWAYARLNTVERILLSQRIAAERRHSQRYVKDRFDLIPPDVERFNYLFRTAIRGRALEAADTGLVPREELARLRPADRFRGALREGAGGAGPAAPAARPVTEAESAWLKRMEAKEKAGAEVTLEADVAGDYFARDEARRLRARRFYVKLDKTEEWAENNYYRLPIEQQNADLVTVNAFWNDYARHDPRRPFLSPNLAEASRNFTEMMLALALLDLPFEADEHKAELKGVALTIEAAGAAVLYHQEIKPAGKAAEKTPILVSQNFFRQGDRYRQVNNERVEKYVTDEFLVHAVYGCHVVVTNPTSSRQKLDVLVQVPRGAIPVMNGQYTRGIHVSLEPYRTHTFDYYFYFPATGQYAHFPVHVAKNEKLVAAGGPVTLKVVERLSRIDKTSWDWISQHGTDEQVVEFLKEQNLNRIKLARIAFRTRDRAFFDRAVPLLGLRHAYDHTLWSYGIKHNKPAAIREFLKHHGAFVGQCGDYIDTPLLTIDPVERKAYQHLEYSPLVNARAHQLGRRRKIVNERLHQQYHRLLKILSYRRQLDDDDLMAVTYYLLLQDRVEKAMGFFARVKPGRLATRLQYDYFQAYVDFFSHDHKLARPIAGKYADYPVDRWRKLFANVAAQLDEIEGKAARVIDAEDRTQEMTKLAATQPGFEFQVEARKVSIHYQNIASCTVNYYLMDIELMFSRQPFVQQYSGQFSYIRPNRSETVTLPKDKTSLAFALPKQFHNRNVMVEIVAGGMTKSQPYFSHSLAVQVIENYGQVKVTRSDSDKPLPKVYVKVYARMSNGQVRFYKDGYTDLRGRFDYTSLNTNELDHVRRFSLLILSETDGAVVREAAPPKR
jgi:hypothetical protein